MLLGEQIGPFVVEKELGSGAMGSVYLAVYTKTGARVAIKIVAPGLAGSDKALERFEREAKILKQLQHPNIVRLVATGKYRQTPFYAMEFIKGESLDKVMARRGRMSWEEVATLGEQLCSALQHAHQRGIIHRDLKPSNLMVLADGTVKLTDFGIAKDLDVTQLTSANCTVGTAAYMSPEQCKGERDLTHKSDLYSLGVMLYELITGRKPFIAETPMDMFLLHVHGQFERPSRLVLDLPIWLDNLLSQLLEKSPDQRPLDASRVGQALGEIKQKVEDQRSAGIEAVQTGIKGRARSKLELDEQDLAAARTLLGKDKKKKKKSRGIPFHHRGWFKAACYSVLLITLVFLIYWMFLKQPTADDLFQKAKKLMASEEVEDWDDARAGPIKDYLKYYGKQDDEQTMQIRAWADQVDLYNKERLLIVWMRRKVALNSDQEKAAKAAVIQEEDGDIDEAKKTWSSLIKHLSDSNADLHGWGLLAQKRLKDLDAVQESARQAIAVLVEADKKNTVLKSKNDFKSRAARAHLYSLFGDFWSARDHWQDLQLAIRQQYDPLIFDQKNAGARAWHLLAAWQFKETKVKAKKVADEDKAKLQLIERQLQVAGKKPETAKEEAHAAWIWRTIIALYGKESKYGNEKNFKKSVAIAGEKHEEASGK